MTDPISNLEQRRSGNEPAQPAALNHLINSGLQPPSKPEAHILDRNQRNQGRQVHSTQPGEERQASDSAGSAKLSTLVATAEPPQAPLQQQPPQAKDSSPIAAFVNNMLGSIAAEAAKQHSPSETTNFDAGHQDGPATAGRKDAPSYSNVQGSMVVLKNNLISNVEKAVEAIDRHYSLQVSKPLEERIAQLEGQVEKLERALESARTEAADAAQLRRQLEELSLALTSAQEVIDGHAASVSELSQAQKKAEESAANASTECEKLKGRVEELQTKLSTETAHFKQLWNDNNSNLKSLKDELERAKKRAVKAGEKAVEAEMKAAKEAAAAAIGRAVAAEAAAEEAAKGKSDAEAEAQDAWQNYNEMLVAKNAAEKAATEAQATVDKLQQKIERAKKNYAKYVEQASGKLEDAEKKFSASENAREAAEKEAAEAKAALQITEQAAEEKAALAEAQLAARLDENGKQAEEIKQLRAQVKLAEGWKEKAAAAEAKAGNAEKQRKEAVAALEALKAKIPSENYVEKVLAEKQRLEEQVTALESEALLLRTDNQSYQQRLNQALQGQRGGNSDAVERAEQKNAFLQTAVKGQQLKIEKLEQQLREAWAEATAAGKTADEAAGHVLDQEHELDQAKLQVSELRTEVRALTCDLAAARNTIEQLKESCKKKVEWAMEEQQLRKKAEKGWTVSLKRGRGRGRGRGAEGRFGGRGPYGGGSSNSSHKRDRETYHSGSHRHRSPSPEYYRKDPRERSVSEGHDEDAADLRDRVHKERKKVRLDYYA